MRVFVTGGTGYIGQVIARELHRKGHQPVLLARRPDAPAVTQLARDCRAEIRPGNVLDPASLAPAMTGTDAVLHLVGIISEIGSNTFQNAHVVATQNVLAAARQAGIRRYVHMSALGTRPAAPSRYHQTKWQAEEAVRESGLDWTIFRPSLVFGPTDHFVNTFARLARFSPVIPVMGSGRGRMQPVAVAEVAHCLVAAIDTPDAIGRTFDLCGPDVLTFRQVLAEIVRATGKRRLFLRVPMPLARIQAAVLEVAFPRLLHRAAPLNRDQLTMLEEDNVGDAQPARELFGCDFTGFREGLAFLQRTNPTATMQ
ncbi:MAG: complex I NDUFA9 subunit family protein [Verrucomicrobiales bacterium]|nr:complex I NDUFA9 subunit family protein [Verrucomicrobiales bacterium]